MPFLKDCWYVAAWSEEIEAGKPCHQQIIGEHVVLFRGDDGNVIALNDTCPHRFAPLHMGKIIGNQIECPYHGLRFEKSGQCAFNPFDADFKSSMASVPAYPVVERDKIIWIWLGNSERADEGLIPDYGWINNEDEYTFTRFLQMRQPINYELVLDNLMDLSHGQFLHPTTLGNEAMASGTTKNRASERTVHSDRLNPNGAAPTLFVIGGGAKEGEKVDFWNDMRWDAPSIYFLQVGVTPAGEPRENGVLIQSAHLITPLDEENLVYRYVIARNFAMGDEDVTRGMEQVIEQAFTREDEPILSQVQKRMAGRDFWELKPVILKTDQAAIMVRRALDKLKRDEARRELPAQLVN